jgi:hypothetical protein
VTRLAPEMPTVEMIEAGIVQLAKRNLRAAYAAMIAKCPVAESVGDIEKRTLKRAAKIALGCQGKSYHWNDACKMIADALAKEGEA